MSIISNIGLTDRGNQRINPNGAILKNLGNINYICGKNCGGKSSIMVAIERLLIKKNIASGSRFNQKNGVEYKAELNDKSHQEKAIERMKRSFGVKSNGHSSIKVINTTGDLKKIEETINETFKGPIAKNVNDLLEKSKKFDIGSFNGNAKIEGIKEIDDAGEEFEKKVYKGIEAHGKLFSLDMQASDGLKKIIKILLRIEKIHKPEDDNIVVVLIEEPENNLHPTNQKKVAEFFSQYVAANPNIQFFITTHSPFILSEAAKDFNSKLYIIEDGECINPDGASMGGMKYYANQILGASIDDFLPKNIFICEGSLESAGNYGFDANIFNTLFKHNNDCIFYSNNSRPEVLTAVAAIGSKAKLNPHIPQTKYMAIIDADKPKTIKEKEEKINALKTLGVETILLGSKSNKEKIEDFLFDDKILDYIEKKESITFNRKNNYGHRKQFIKDNNIDDINHFIFKMIIPAILETQEEEGSIYKKLRNEIFGK